MSSEPVVQPRGGGHGRRGLILEVVAPGDPGAFEEGSAFSRLVASVAGSAVWTSMAVADRVHSDTDPDSLETALRVASPLGHPPLVHVTGKDRTTAQALATARRGAAAGLAEVLLMTGDRVKDRDREEAGRVPYADSVNLVGMWREHAPGVRRGVVVNPFKTTEEDLRNQLLKLSLKVGAGAQVVTTQIGFSWQVLEAFARYAGQAHPGLELRAALCHLPLGIARVLAGGSVPGVVLPGPLWERIQQDAREPDARDRYAWRTAVGIVALHALGYQAVQVACVHTAAAVERIGEAVARLQAQQRSLAELAALWAEVFADHDQGFPMTTPPVGELASGWEKARYRVLDALDHAVFDLHDPRGARVNQALRVVARRPAGRRLLQVVEDTSKGALVGCQMCGFCRLPYTMYVCPETCPKGLANGPCGGTSEGRCEFGDRECVHNRKYRTAQAFDRVEELARTVIPPVPAGVRGTSSWVNHAQGLDPVPLRLDPGAPVAPGEEAARTAAEAAPAAGVPR